MSYKIDLSYLNEITGFENEIMVEMIDLFLEETPKQITILRESFETENWNQLGAEAHKLKPTFLYVGLSQLNELTLEMEKFAKDRRNLDQIGEMIEELERGYSEVIPSLTEERDRLAANI